MHEASWSDESSTNQAIEPDVRSHIPEDGSWMQHALDDLLDSRLI